MKVRYLGAFTLLLGLVGVISDTQRILWGQCYSNCLTQHADDISQVANDKRRGKPSLIKSCRRVLDCKTCLFACDRSPTNYTSQDSCVNDCDVSIGSEYPNYESCRQSCRFLATVSRAKVGICPSKESMSGFQVACVDQCYLDADCSTNKKCCDNGCGFTCQRPTNNTSLPKRPVDIRFDTRKDGGIVVSWDLPKGSWQKHAIRPFVYVVRWRNLRGNGHNFLVTDRTYLKLRGIVPASTLHVIVAAVNIHGSRGFTTVKVHTKEFMKPSPPVNFEEGTTTWHDDGKVDVEIKWQPPHQTEGLPINRYVVLRSEGLPKSSAVYHRVNMKRYRIPPNRHKYTFKDLLPGTRYFVQVYATVRWSQKIHKGRMASRYILTYSPPVEQSTTPAPVRTVLSGPSAIYNITVDQSIYDGGVLKTRISWRSVSEEVLSKYLVYWHPTNCDPAGRRTEAFPPPELSATTHEEMFSLYNLHYSCNYTVRIKPVNNFNDILAGSVASFTTPHCVDIQVQGEIRPDCPIVPRTVPARPSDIQIHWLIDRCSVDVAITWVAPLSHQPITGYAVKWGWSQEVSPSSRKVVYNTHPKDLSISGNSTEVILTDMQSARHYTVQISGISQGGEGEPAIKHFKTRRKACIPSTFSAESSTLSAAEVNDETFISCDDGSVQNPACSSSCALIGSYTIYILILSILMH